MLWNNEQHSCDDDDDDNNNSNTNNNYGTVLQLKIHSWVAYNITSEIKDESTNSEQCYKISSPKHSISRWWLQSGDDRRIMEIYRSYQFSSTRLWTATACSDYTRSSSMEF